MGKSLGEVGCYSRKCGCEATKSAERSALSWSTEGREMSRRERERETLEELIMRASNVNLNVGTTKQKGAVMPRKFGGPNRQGVKRPR